MIIDYIWAWILSMAIITSGEWVGSKLVIKLYQMFYFNHYNKKILALRKRNSQLDRC